mgnify:CR=1 FL=1
MNVRLSDVFAAHSKLSNRGKYTLRARGTERLNVLTMHPHLNGKLGVSL